MHWLSLSTFTITRHRQKFYWKVEKFWPRPQDKISVLTHENLTINWSLSQKFLGKLWKKFYPEFLKTIIIPVDDADICCISKTTSPVQLNSDFSLRLYRVVDQCESLASLFQSVHRVFPPVLPCASISNQFSSFLVESRRKFKLRRSYAPGVLEILRRSPAISGRITG